MPEEKELLMDETKKYIKGRAATCKQQLSYGGRHCFYAGFAKTN
jgi:hypothetical protein